jgi:hypothetical protein
VLQVDDDPTNGDIAALDDRLAASTVAAVGHGSRYEPVGEVEDAAGKRLDTQPAPKGALILRTTLWLGATVLLVAEAHDVVRTLRRRARHLLAESWADIQLREQRRVRRAVAAAVAVRIVRNRPGSRPGLPREPSRQLASPTPR